jgi:hypothetical protein
MNYRIKNSSIFQENIKRLERYIIINSNCVKILKEILEKETLENESISFNDFLVIIKYNEYLKV